MLAIDIILRFDIILKNIFRIIKTRKKQMMKIPTPSNSLERREYSYLFQKEKKKINFDFSVQYDYHSEKKLVKINRYHLLINYEKPDETLIGNLVSQASEALFPITLQINSSGYPIGIFNHSEILERWRSFIPRFEDYYDNPLSIKLLNRIGNLYKNPVKLLKGLRNDWFFSTFFFPIYGEYENDEAVKINYPFPSVLETAIYETELFINDEKTDKGKTDISLFGNSPSNDNKVHGNFLLNSDRSIHEIKINFNISDRENISIHIWEIKEISERKMTVSVLYDEKEEKKSKGFFVEEIKGKDLPKHK